MESKLGSNLSEGFNRKPTVLQRVLRHKVSAFFVVFTAASIYYDYSATQRFKAEKQREQDLKRAQNNK